MDELIKAGLAAVHALRSYQYGNASPELAEEIADVLEAAILQNRRDRAIDLKKGIAQTNKQLARLSQKLKEAEVPQLPAHFVTR